MGVLGKILMIDILRLEDTLLSSYLITFNVYSQ